MKHYILIALLFALVGCDTSVERKESEMLHEHAKVVSLIYSPSNHDISLGKTMMDDYTSPLGGVDYNGNKGIKLGNVNGEDIQLNISKIPEVYGAVFQCQHGTFTIQGNGTEEGSNTVTKYRTLYDKLNGHVGDTVNILYKEVHTYVYKKEENGAKVLQSKTLEKLDFVDAQLMN